MSNRDDVLARIRELGLLAVLRGPTPDLTMDMVGALVEGGVLGIEITFSTPNAAKVVQRLGEIHGERIVLGMGTVTMASQVGEALEAGARFLVSPHSDRELAEEMRRSGLPFMLGALTPTEVMQAVKWGADVVKIFPGSLGGPAYLKALRDPMPDIPMMVTGGVRVDNIVDWFAAGAVVVGAGGSMCPPALAAAGQLEEITARAREYVAAVRAARAQVPGVDSGLNARPGAWPPGASPRVKGAG